MKNYLGIDIGGSKLAMAAFDEEGKIARIKQKNYANVYTASELMKDIEKLSKEFQDRNFSACGVAIPGLCDSTKGIWMYSPYTQIKKYPIKEKLENMLEIPVYIENDVNISALGEKKLGCCQDVDDFMWITLSNGIGGALFLNGKLYRGTGGNAGEIGHFVMDESSPALCGCGRNGCLESLASGIGISHAYERKKGISLSAREIATIAKKGEKEAIEVYQDAGRYLGKAFAYAVNLLNIDVIVYGGGLANQDSLFLPALKKAFNDNVFAAANENTRIMPTKFLRYGASIMGCFALAEDRYERH